MNWIDAEKENPELTENEDCYLFSNDVLIKLENGAITSGYLIVEKIPYNEIETYWYSTFSQDVIYGKIISWCKID